MAQWPFNYIPDWPRQFFSNLDLMSDESMMTFMEEPPRINFRSTFRFDDLYQEKIEPGIERAIYSWTLTHDFEYPLTVFSSKVRIGAHYQSYEKKIDYEFNTNESIRIINEAKTYSLSMAIQPWREYLEFDIRVGKKSLDSEVYFPWKGGLGFTWKKYFQLRYDKGLDYFVWDYQIQFRQPAINLSVPEKADIDQVLFSVPVFPRLEFNALLRINSLNDQQEFDKNRTTLILVGDQYHRWLSIAFRSKPKMVWSFNYRNWQTDIDGYFYDQGQVFGKFTKRQEFSESYSPEFRYSWSNQHLGLHLDWGKGEIINRGQVESWPFTPVWIDLLGLRYSFNSKLIYHFVRLGGYYLYIFPTWQVRIELCGERILPSGEARTWEPELIGIGIKNLTVYQLSEKNRDGIYMGINLSKKIRRFLRVAYQFNQYIPVDFSGSAEGKPGKGSVDKQQYGGGRHIIELILYL